MGRSPNVGASVKIFLISFRNLNMLQKVIDKVMTSFR